MCLVFGLLLGFGIDLLIHKRRLKRKMLKNKAGEVVVVVNCSENQLQMVETTFYDHYAVGVAVIRA